MHKNNRQNSENNIFTKNGTYVEEYTAGHLRTKFEKFILIYEAMIAIKWVWPTFGYEQGQSDPIVMQLKLDMSCHLLNVYTKFQIDISKHVEEKSRKRGRTDGRTDGQTDGHCHGIIRPVFQNTMAQWSKWVSFMPIFVCCMWYL